MLLFFLKPTVLFPSFSKLMKIISQAAVAMEDREEKLDAIYNMIEKDLSLVGRAL